MSHVEGTFAGVGGLEIFFQQWLPDSQPTAVIALVHGVGEHSGRYMGIVKPLVDAGYAVCAYDHRGHGRSEGRRVHIDRWTEYREDLRTYLALLAEKLPGVPVVLYGHSMGSLVVLDFLLAHPEGIAGAIISGVALEPAGVGSPMQIAIARVLTHVTPRVSIDLGIDAESLTQDADILAAYKQDELTTSRATVRWGTESLDTVARIKRDMGTIEIPLLVVHGGADPLNMVSGAEALCSAAFRADTQLRVYPDVRHEPHNDLAREELATDVVAWLGNSLSA